MTAPRRSKYRAVPETVGGIRFASKKEARRASELKLLERAGQIRNLELQPRYDIIVNGINCGFYKADFRYFEGNKAVVEDAKGFKTQVYSLKKRLVEALYGITITEV